MEEKKLAWPTDFDHKLTKILTNYVNFKVHDLVFIPTDEDY